MAMSIPSVCSFEKMMTPSILFPNLPVWCFLPLHLVVLCDVYLWIGSGSMIFQRSFASGRYPRSWLRNSSGKDYLHWRLGYVPQSEEGVMSELLIILRERSLALWISLLPGADPAKWWLPNSLPWGSWVFSYWRVSATNDHVNFVKIDVDKSQDIALEERVMAWSIVNDNA